MEGESIKQAKAALQLLLAILQPEDRFNIIAFGSDYKFFSPSLLEYNDSTLSEARNWVRERDADMGGTNVLPAIMQALNAAKGYEQSIILLTDGDVGNTRQIIQEINKAERPARIYTIGLGYNTDEELLYTLANETGAAMEIVYPGENLSQVVSRHLSRIRSAKAESICLTWGNKEELLPSSDYSFLPEESKWFMKHFDAKPEGTVQLRIVFEDKTELQLQSNPLQEVAADFAALPQIYAKHMFQLKGKTSRGSLQRNRKDKSQAIKLSKQYGVLCSETSFILVDPLTKQEMRSRIGLRRVPVAMGLSLKMLPSSLYDMSICDSRTISEQKVPAQIDFCLAEPEIHAKPAPSLSEEIVLIQCAKGYWDDEVLLRRLKVHSSEFSKFIEEIMEIHKLQEDSAHKVATSLMYWYYLEFCDKRHKTEHLHIIGKAEQWLESQGIDCTSMIPRLEYLWHTIPGNPYV